MMIGSEQRMMNEAMIRFHRIFNVHSPVATALTVVSGVTRTVTLCRRHSRYCRNHDISV